MEYIAKANVVLTLHFPLIRFHSDANLSFQSPHGTFTQLQQRTLLSVCENLLNIQKLLLQLAGSVYI